MQMQIEKLNFTRRYYKNIGILSYELFGNEHVSQKA